MAIDVLKMIEAAKEEVANRATAAQDFMTALDAIKEQSGGRFGYELHGPSSSDEMSIVFLLCETVYPGWKSLFHLPPAGKEWPIRANLTGRGCDEEEFKTAKDAIEWIVRKLADSHVFNNPAPDGTQPS